MEPTTLPSERSYPVPRTAACSLLSDRATMTEIDLLLSSGRGSGEARAWCQKMRDSFVAAALDRVTANGVLPLGVVTFAGDVDIVVGLTDGERLYGRDGWGSEPVRHDDVLPLNEEEVAFSASAIDSGMGLALMAAAPLAFIRVDSLTAAGGEPPGRVVAIVDEVDKSAVMEMLSIAPGPTVYRRHDGEWHQDDGWLFELRGIKPPPVVSLDPALVATVQAQVDEATKGKPFEALVSSAWDQRLFEMQCYWATVRAEPLTLESLTAAMPAKLARYWLYGAGAAKIRWFSPGAWRRCHRQLSKYMNPRSAAGACTNLSQRLGGQGVATHVG